MILDRWMSFVFADQPDDHFAQHDPLTQLCWRVGCGQFSQVFFSLACHACSGAAGARPNKARSSGRVSCWPIISSILSFGHSPRSILERMAAPTRILRRVSSARFCLASAVFTLASAFCFNALACLSLSSKSLTRCCAFSMLVAMIVLCGLIWHSIALKWCRKASYNGGADRPGEERKRRARAHLGVDCVNSCSPAAG